MITFSGLGTQGRMSNQLLEIAATIALALRNNDTYIFPPWEHEADFNLHNCFSSDIKFKHTYVEPCFEYKPIPYKSDMNLQGYWQSFKYFEDFMPQIQELLTPIYHFNRVPGLCSIHVRRGDYLKFADAHPQQPMSYYHNAMEIINAKRYLIFSDDIEWCKQNFIGNEFDFSEYMTPAMDMAMMIKKCEHNIICNSSFSLWAAYMNQSPNKKVVAPKLWFGPSMKHNTKDLYMSDWTLI